MEKAGHSNIKARMKSTGALLAGEMSGHFFFKDRWFGFDDGIYAALRCLEILNKDKNAFNNLSYGIVTPEIRIPCDDNKKFKIIESVKKTLQGEGISFADIDGIRFSSNNGWWLIRASNTQGALSIRIEASSQKDMREMKQKISSLLRKNITNIDEFLDIKHE